jgi:hypothetical protein
MKDTALLKLKYTEKTEKNDYPGMAHVQGST